MKIADTKLKKTVLIVISLVIVIIAVVIILISPIAKYLIKKYDDQLTGRQITLDWIYVNPFTGYAHISNLKIYESKSLSSSRIDDSIFFSAKGLSVNIAMLKILSKTIEISEITVDQPKGKIIQNEREFNFNDLIKKFTPGKKRTTPSSFHFNILVIKINNGEFYYHENLFPINYFIRKVNFESAGKRWNSDTIAVKFSLLQGTGSGSMKGDFTINFKTSDYRFAVVAQKFDLNIIEQYLKDMMNYGSFSASLDADIKAKGNLKNEENVTASGQLAINDFHFGKNPKDDYASFDKLVLELTEVSPKNHKYLLDSVSLIHPFIKYERYDYLDNLQMIFGKNGSKISAANADPGKFNLVIEIARYVKVLVKNFLQSYYKINRIAIYNGDLKFNDFAISEKFSVDLNPLYIIADSVDKNHDRLKVTLTSGIKPYGKINLTLNMNPKDGEDFELQYHLKNIPATVFNPYLISYTSYPLDRGTIEINGEWNVKDGFIRSKNHLLVIDPRRTTRVKNEDAKWLPLPLIMSLIRERGNVIDYQIPISGNLKDPEFHWHDVLMDFLENIFVKPATAPYRLDVKNTESEIEESLTLKWDMRQQTLYREQEIFVKKMVDYLIDNPEASISVYPIHFAEKEKEYIQFFEAKKKYFSLINHKNAQSFSKDDSLMVEEMSVKDSVFVYYLNKINRNTMLFTIQEKCHDYIGSAFINSKFRRLNRERADAFKFNFRKNAVENRLKLYAGEDNIPYNGFSYYKIVYKGELPKSLLKAYRKMNKLNSESPRKKYKEKRKKSKPLPISQMWE